MIKGVAHFFIREGNETLVSTTGVQLSGWDVLYYTLNA
jgi:hypothetical protein